MKYADLMVSLLLAFQLSCFADPIVEEEDLFFSSESVCDCNKSAIGIYRALLEEEKQEHKELFWKLREECLTKYGILLFYPSECNDVYTLDTLADSLILAGIDING